MSYDFALQKLCSHEVRKETVVFDGIAGLIRFSTPPTNQRLSLWIDGVAVPQSGLYSTATIAFMNPGPYRIKRDQNDLLYFRVGNEAPVFIQLLTGYVKAADLAADLAKKLPQLVFAAERDRVVIRSRTPVNGAAFAFADPRWTDKTQSLPTTSRVLAAYAKLGIVPGRVVVGKQLFPPWTLEQYTGSADKYEKVVRFHGIIPNRYPVIHASYVTYPNYCRRCKGSKIEFDYNIVNNTYELVEDADLLSQELDKFMFTRLGSHWRWPWLGSRLIDRIGGKGSTGRGTINSLLSLDVTQAFTVYQNIKTQQNQNPWQQVTDAEFPMSIRSVNVTTMPDDPTIALVNITVVCRSREPVTLKRIVGNPNPYIIAPGMGVAADPSFLLRG